MSSPVAPPVAPPQRPPRPAAAPPARDRETLFPMRSVRPRADRGSAAAPQAPVRDRESAGSAKAARCPAVFAPPPSGCLLRPRRRSTGGVAAPSKPFLKSIALSLQSLSPGRQRDLDILQSQQQAVSRAAQPPRTGIHRKARQA